MEVERDCCTVPGHLEIKEQTSTEPLNARFPKVNEAFETPGKTRSSCQITDTDSRLGREPLTNVNEKISVKLRQTETDTVHQAQALDLEAEPEWITKIKTFKITKVLVLFRKI